MQSWICWMDTVSTKCSLRGWEIISSIHFVPTLTRYCFLQAPTKSISDTIGYWLAVFPLPFFIG